MKVENWKKGTEGDQNGLGALCNPISMHKIHVVFKNPFKLNIQKATVRLNFIKISSPK